MQIIKQEPHEPPSKPPKLCISKDQTHVWKTETKEPMGILLLKNRSVGMCVLNKCNPIHPMLFNSRSPHPVTSGQNAYRREAKEKYSIPETSQPPTDAVLTNKRCHRNVMQTSIMKLYRRQRRIMQRGTEHSNLRRVVKGGVEGEPTIPGEDSRSEGTASSSSWPTGEPGWRLRRVRNNHMMQVKSQHTFEELLAGILLEESLMSDGAAKVVNHEQEDRLNLLFRVSSVMSDSSILK